MRQREHVVVRDVELVVQDIQVARARPVLDLADAAQAVLDGVQISQQLLRRDTRAQQHHGVDERVLVLVVGRFAFIEAGNVDDLRIGKAAQLGDGLVEHGDLALKLLAGLCHQRHIAAQAQERVRAHVGQRLHGFRHVVRTHNARAQLARHKRLGGAHVVALDRVVDAVGEAQIAFAGNGNHDRVAQARKLLEVAYELESLRSRFAEARARVDADALRRHAGGLEHGRLVAQVIAHLGDHIVVLRVLLHGARLALHVHDHHAAIAFGGNLHHGRIAEARHVVDDGGAGFHARLRHSGMTGVHAHADALLGKGAHHGKHAGRLLLDAHLGRPRARGLAAHVDHMRALIEHLLRPGQRRLGRVVRAAVAEAVGRDVEDAHDHRFTRIELERAAFPHHAECLSFKRRRA